LPGTIAWRQAPQEQQPFGLARPGVPDVMGRNNEYLWTFKVALSSIRQSDFEVRGETNLALMRAAFSEYFEKVLSDG
jgi:hypothetical protein